MVKVTVNLIEASGLPNIDPLIRPRARCIISISNSETHYTSSKIESTAPKWNETFVFNLSSIDTSELQIVIYDEMEKLASTTIPLTDFMEKRGTSEWYIMKNELDSESSPRLRIEVAFDGKSVSEESNPGLAYNFYLRDKDDKLKNDTVERRKDFQTKNNNDVFDQQFESPKKITESHFSYKRSRSSSLRRIVSSDKAYRRDSASVPESLSPPIIHYNSSRTLNVNSMTEAKSKRVDHRSGLPEKLSSKDFTPDRFSILNDNSGDPSRRCGFMSISPTRLTSLVKSTSHHHGNPRSTNEFCDTTTPLSQRNNRLYMSGPVKASKSSRKSLGYVSNNSYQKNGSNKMSNNKGNGTNNTDKSTHTNLHKRNMSASNVKDRKPKSSSSKIESRYYSQYSDSNTSKSNKSKTKRYDTGNSPQVITANSDEDMISPNFDRRLTAVKENEAVLYYSEVANKRTSIDNFAPSDFTFAPGNTVALPLDSVHKDEGEKPFYPEFGCASLDGKTGEFKIVLTENQKKIRSRIEKINARRARERAEQGVSSDPVEVISFVKIIKEANQRSIQTYKTFLEKFCQNLIKNQGICLKIKKSEEAEATNECSKNE